VTRLVKAYRVLERDQRQAAIAAVALLATMFLPWYEKSFFVPSTGKPAHDSISAFGAVSFVEAAIFLVSAGVLVLLLARADERPFHLPGGDGTVIFGAGLWATLLIFYRVFDRPNAGGDGGTLGIQWGFFVAFVAARGFLGPPRWSDAAAVGIFLAAEPVIEWVVHSWILHARPWRVLGRTFEPSATRGHRRHRRRTRRRGR